MLNLQYLYFQFLCLISRYVFFFRRDDTPSTIPVVKAERPCMPPSQGLASAITQMYPPKLTFTEENVEDLSGKVRMPFLSKDGVMH